jgi:hypothetical protein
MTTYVLKATKRIVETFGYVRCLFLVEDLFDVLFELCYALQPHRVLSLCEGSHLVAGWLSLENSGLEQEIKSKREHCDYSGSC